MMTTVAELIKELSNGLENDEYSHVHIGYNWNMTHMADIDDIKIDEENKTVIIIGKNCITRLLQDFNKWTSWKISEMIEKLSSYPDYKILGKCNFPLEMLDYDNDLNNSYKNMNELQIEKISILNAGESLVDWKKRLNKPVYSAFIQLMNEY